MDKAMILPRSTQKHERIFSGRSMPYRHITAAFYLIPAFSIHCHRFGIRKCSRLSIFAPQLLNNDMQYKGVIPNQVRDGLHRDPTTYRLPVNKK